MSIIARGFKSMCNTVLGRFVDAKMWNLTKSCVDRDFTDFTKITRKCNSFHHGWEKLLWKLHVKGPPKKKEGSPNPLGRGVPFAKGVVLKTLIKKPRKPNSANRKCVLVRLSSGKEMVAFVPGIGHNLQEHNIVLVRPGRLKDTPGVLIRCVRGKYDLGHVIKPEPNK